MVEREKAIVRELRQHLAKDRTQLLRHEELLGSLQIPVSEMREYRVLEKVLRDTPIGDWLLAADQGDAAARLRAKQRAVQALLAQGMQAQAATRIVDIIAEALDWEKTGTAVREVSSERTSAPSAAGPEVAPPSAVSTTGSATTWDCACGQKGNTDAFCMNCGRPRPQGGSQARPSAQTAPRAQVAETAAAQLREQPPQQPYAAAQPAAGGKQAQIALIAVIVVLAGVLVFFGMRAFGGRDGSDAAPRAQTTSASDAAPSKPANQGKPETPQPSATQRAMKTDLSLGGIDLGDATSIIKEVEKGKTENDRKQDGTLVRHYFDDMQIVTEGSEITALVSNDDKVTTKRGIHQGSSFAEVKRAYGTDYYKTGLGGNLTAFEYEAQTADGRPGLVRFAINDDTHKVDYISVRLTR